MESYNNNRNSYIYIIIQTEIYFEKLLFVIFDIKMFVQMWTSFLVAFLASLGLILYP